MTEGAGGSAASAAAEQVRAIVAAAEQSAAAIRAEAERDAAQSRDRSARVAERAAELESRLDALAEGVREGIESLRAELAELRERPPGAPAEPPARGSAEVDEELIAEVEAVAAPEPDVRAPEEPPTEPAAPAAAPEAAPPEAAAPEGARVLALKMALDGAPREDTARYLRENFELDDPDALLDEVYAKAGR